jgi:hypothetical protein
MGTTFAVFVLERPPLLDIVYSLEYISLLAQWTICVVVLRAIASKYVGISFCSRASCPVLNLPFLDLYCRN